MKTTVSSYSARPMWNELSRLKEKSMLIVYTQSTIDNYFQQIELV